MWFPWCLHQKYFPSSPFHHHAWHIVGHKALLGRNWPSLNSLQVMGLCGRWCGQIPSLALGLTLSTGKTTCPMMEAKIETPSTYSTIMGFRVVLIWTRVYVLRFMFSCHPKPCMFFRSKWSIVLYKMKLLELNAIYMAIIVAGVIGLRLYIHLILSCSESSFASLWATVCSSWVRINAYTSCRSVLNPEGDTGKKYISQANCMMSRPLVFAKYFLFCDHAVQ